MGNCKSKEQTEQTQQNAPPPRVSQYPEIEAKIKQASEDARRIAEENRVKEEDDLRNANTNITNILVDRIVSTIIESSRLGHTYMRVCFHCVADRGIDISIDGNVVCQILLEQQRRMFRKYYAESKNDVVEWFDVIGALVDCVNDRIVPASMNLEYRNHRFLLHTDIEKSYTDGYVYFNVTW